MFRSKIETFLFSLSAIGEGVKCIKDIEGEITMTDYRSLCEHLAARIKGIPYETANLANAAALLWEYMPDINWAGFYKIVDDQLVLGPFQGKAARVIIPVGQGVCGTAVAENTVQRVANVHNFCGHIACDCASNSEIVLPIHVKGRIWGVLDMDSPVFERFTEADQAGLEQFVAILAEVL